ncbi:MAG: Rrf2 family transcriptional regulator [Nitrospirae bacterium]|nr:Rrf2 family transcriptional regulator [Nitrospirota bacterium]
MQITRETDYAIRCVLYLTSRTDRVIMVDEIAREMATPKSFLSKILQKLVKADIARSFRGVKGGFQLNREPRDITLLDVIEAVEGAIALNTCVLDTSACGFSGTCAVHPVWVRLRGEVNELLARHNFADIARDIRPDETGS